MSGPSVTRLSNAGSPSLTQPGLNILQTIFGGGGGQGPGGVFGVVRNAMGTGSPVQQLAPDANLLGRMQNLFGQSALQQQLGNTYSQVLNQGNLGQNVLSAYQPLFQQNLQEIQGSGPRFSSGNDLLRQRALSDYNAFAAQTLMQGQQQQLGALAGASNFAQSQSGQNLALMQQLLGTLFKGGGVGEAPIYNVQPGLGQQLLGLAGSLGGAALGGGLFGGGGNTPPQTLQNPFSSGGWSLVP